MLAAGLQMIEDQFAIIIESPQIGAEGLPDFSITLRRVAESASTGTRDARIQARKVDELHRNGRWGAANKICQFDNLRRCLMHSPERHLAIEMEGQLQLVAGPIPSYRLRLSGQTECPPFETDSDRKTEI